ncbi:organ-specific protein S2-like [Vicia villosa]|uniref:organ-specific protein S2-like n=1 Tax=Vicia villosa TaxID=3911 RepID=UPI00273C0807|nr:organ-specific protein S2-like [Vicia villosa]
MKYIFVIFLLFSLLFVGNLSFARKDMGEYWKNMMKDEAMPEAIKGLIHDHQATYEEKDRFVRDFDVKPNLILYHTHVTSMKQNHEDTTDMVGVGS